MSKRTAEKRLRLLRARYAGSNLFTVQRIYNEWLNGTYNHIFNSDDRQIIRDGIIEWSKELQAMRLIDPEGNW